MDIKIQAWVAKVSNPKEAVHFLDDASSIRKKDGYSYHHRFNAKTWSTYDRCLEEMKLCVQDEVEPWFAKSEWKGLFGFPV